MERKAAEAKEAARRETERKEADRKAAKCQAAEEKETTKREAARKEAERIAVEEKEAVKREDKKLEETSEGTMSAGILLALPLIVGGAALLALYWKRKK